jgi:hypothetical protein
MKLAAAQSLVAWLWAQHPGIVTALARTASKPGLSCLTCDFDILSSAACDGSSFLTSGTCVIGCAGLDASGIALGCAPLDSLGAGCLPTITCADLTPVSTSAVTGGCDINIASCASVGSSTAAGSSSLSGVASYVASGVSGLAALAKVAAAYFNAQAASSAAAAAQAKAQAAIVAAQTARASAGQSALPITYVANGAGSSTPLLSTTSGLVPLTDSTLASLTPNAIEVFFAQYGNWILIGGAAAFLVYASTRRRAT